MAMAAAEIKALVRSKGWTFVDLAARWGLGVFYMSRLVNDPHGRPPMYDDAFRGLPQRETVRVARERRHQRRLRPARAIWTPEQMFPLGRLFEAIDNRFVEEGTSLTVSGVTKRAGEVTVIFVYAEASEPIALSMELAQRHFADTGLDS